MEDWLANDLQQIQWPAKPSCLLHIHGSLPESTWKKSVIKNHDGGGGGGGGGRYIIEIQSWCNQATSLMHPCNWFGAEGWPL